MCLAPCSLLRFGLPLLSFAVILGTLSSVSLPGWLYPFSQQRVVDHDIVSYLGDVPLELTPTSIKVALPVSRRELATFAELVAVSPKSEHGQTARSRILHSSRLSTLLGSRLDWFVHDDAGRIVKVQLPDQAFTASWRGLEVVETAEGERTEHRDQLLASLAEAGVPLSCRIEIAEEERTVSDLLRTSVNEFHLNQKEISWTTVAYALYLPPQASWMNRYGEHFTFDHVADVLMNRSLASESCRGIHLVSALTYLLLADREIPILTPSTRDHVESHLTRRVKQAMQSQLPDGSWPLRWSSDGFHGAAGDSFTPPSTLSLRVTVTGHLLEWFHFLPASLKPADTTTKAGLLWLWSQLQSASQEQISTDFCPFTHAIQALDLAIPLSDLRGSACCPGCEIGGSLLGGMS